MKSIIKSLLIEKNIKCDNISDEVLYNAGMENVKNNIEFYHDKTFTCESVIKELFIRGIINFIKSGNFPYLDK